MPKDSAPDDARPAPPLVPRRRVRVLFINDTARNGGPGRSLYYILKFLDPAVIHRAVMLPRSGVISELYEKDPVADDLLFEPYLVENPIEPWSRAMAREDFDAPPWRKGARAVANIGKGAAGIFRIASVAQRGQFDLIYCNGTNANFAGGALSWLTGIPALWHVRYTSIPTALKALHDNLATSQGVRTIVCVSGAAAALFPGAKHKVKVIHNALDPEEFAASNVAGGLRAELGLASDVCVFGSQGRILPRKGYVEMIRAAKIAVQALSEDERRRIHFVVLGDTPQDMRPDHVEECRALVRELDLSAYFKFTGFRADVKPYVTEFDVAVVPSVYPDPLPRAVIEGMAMGKPVIAFDVGGVAEMLKDGATGTLVRGVPPDIDGLARQFVRYFRDPALRREQGLASRARILRDFDANRQAKRIQDEIVLASGLLEATS